MYLATRKDQSWRRTLRRLVKAHDRGRVSDHLIADYLANLNHQAHGAVPDTVGPSSIVVWRRRPDARPGAPGGAHQFYTGIDRDSQSAGIPTIANGMDLQGITGVLMPHFLAQFESEGFGPAAFDVDKDEMNRLLAELPDEPDEKLR